jgi:catechol 2,3-dioxygenase-like lactoylglutathione lyase family enzyme
MNRAGIVVTLSFLVLQTAAEHAGFNLPGSPWRAACPSAREKASPVSNRNERRVSMFSHVMVGANDVAASKAFYDGFFTALGGNPGMQMGERVFYQHNGGAFGVGKPVNGELATFANGGTIGFKAEGAAQVDAAHAAGLANGGTCDGPPGKRPNAPGNAYGAYLRDPVGNKLCVFCQLPAGE